MRKEDSSSSDEETPQDSPTPLIKVSKISSLLMQIWCHFSRGNFFGALKTGKNTCFHLNLFQIKSGHGKGPSEFEKLRLLQDLSGEHVVCILSKVTGTTVIHSTSLTCDSF